MENECEALPGVAYPGVRDNRSTLNTKTGYDDDDDDFRCVSARWSADNTQRSVALFRPVSVHCLLCQRRAQVCVRYTGGRDSRTARFVVLLDLCKFILSVF